MGSRGRGGMFYVVEAIEAASYILANTSMSMATCGQISCCTTAASRQSNCGLQFALRPGQ